MFKDIFEKHPSLGMRHHLETVFSDLSSHELTLRIQEFLKFICLQSLKDSGFIPVSEEIDLIWHEYILQTRAYETLCQDLPGKKFVHHQTISLIEYTQQKNNRYEIAKAMLDWIPKYRKYFGNFTEETAHYWLIVDFLIKNHGFTLEKINKI